MVVVQLVARTEEIVQSMQVPREDILINLFIE